MIEEERKKDYRSLGEILREAREARQKSIEDLSEITKISPRILRAFEADDLDQVANPVYARSFVRTLAETLQLDGPWLLTKLEHAVAAVQSRDQSAPPARPESTWHIENVRIQRVETPPKRSMPRLVIGIVLIVALGLVGLWFVRQGNGEAPGPDRRVQGSAPGDAGRVEVAMPAVPEPSPAEVAVRDDASANGSEKAAAPKEDTTRDVAPAGEAPKRANAGSTGATAVPGTMDAGNAEPATKPAASKEPAPAVAQRQEPPSTTPPAAAGEDPEDAPPESAPSSSGESASAPPVEEEVIVDESTSGLSSIVRAADPEAERPLMTLEIRATGRVDVIVAADGQAHQQRTLAADDVWRLTARDHFSLEISEPRRVEVALDGIRHDPPPGLVGEWILYPNSSPR